MYSLNELKPGRAIVLDGDPFLILSAQFSKVSKGQGNNSTKLRNLKTGAVINKTFSGNTKVEPADVGYKHVQFLFKGDDSCTFMDLTSYDQFELSNDLMGDDVSFLTDGLELDVQVFQDTPIAVKLPPTVNMKIMESPPGVKGDTAQGGTKPATFETGLVVNVPLFVNEGDTVKVNTERKEYVERV